MKRLVLATVLGATLSAQSGETADSRVAAAKALAANDPTALIDLCTAAGRKSYSSGAHGGASPRAASSGSIAMGT